MTRGSQKPHFGAHLDPDLDPTSYAPASGWRPLFGQAGGSQTGTGSRRSRAGGPVSVFGWFRRVEERGGPFRFVRDAPDLHVLWGWLQVGTVLRLPTATAPSWAQYHPLNRTGIVGGQLM